MTIGDQTAVVFGGGGFIGRHLVRRLGKAGAVIRVPSRHVSRLGFLRTNGFVGQIVPEMVDLSDDESLRAAIAGADIVVNLIGILSPSRKDGFDTVHARLSGRIAAIAAAAGVSHLVHVSAIGADPGSESAYARSKAAGEAAVRSAFPAAVILRPSIVFGPEDQFFNRFAAMATMSPALPLIGGGLTRFQPVYVGDVADAIMAAIARPEAAGKTYELGGPGIYSFKALMQLMLAEIGLDRLLVPLPWGLAKLQASLLSFLPNPPLTLDQIALLQVDNVISGTAPGLIDLGITPTAAEVMLPTYMDRFRTGGRFDRRRKAYP